MFTLWFDGGSVGIHKSCLFFSTYICRVYSVYHLLFPFDPAGQLHDTIVPQYHGSPQGHVYGARSAYLPLNLAAPPRVSPLLTRKRKSIRNL